jgi:maltose alpha-D-glucosyltransferase/alpha-amylase
MGGFLTRAGFRSSAALCASITYVDAEPIVIATLFAYVGNQGDAWTYSLNHLDRYAADMYSQDVAVESPHALFTRQMRTLGRRVGTLHALLARAPADDAAFAPEAFEAADLERLCETICRDARSALESLSDKMPVLTRAIRRPAESLLTQRRTLLQRIREMASVSGGEPLQGLKTRLHGNLRLSKVLLMADDLLITGFEGDPTLTLAQRRRKDTPLYDVASLLRSFDHARAAALERVAAGRPDLSDDLEPALLQWREVASKAFLKGYRASVKGAGCVPADKTSFMRQLNLLQIGLATRELMGLLNSDPGRIDAPIAALLELINGHAGR